MIQKDPLDGKWQPLQYPCQGNPMDRGTWWAIVHGVAESDDLVTKQQLTEVRPLSSQTKREDSLCENKNLIFLDGYILME